MHSHRAPADHRARRGGASAPGRMSTRFLSSARRNGGRSLGPERTSVVRLRATRPSTLARRVTSRRIRLAEAGFGHLRFPPFRSVWCPLWCPRRTLARPVRSRAIRYGGTRCQSVKVVRTGAFVRGESISGPRFAQMGRFGGGRHGDSRIMIPRRRFRRSTGLRHSAC